MSTELIGKILYEHYELHNPHPTIDERLFLGKGKALMVILASWQLSNTRSAKEIAKEI